MVVAGNAIQVFERSPEFVTRSRYPQMDFLSAGLLEMDGNANSVIRNPAIIALRSRYRKILILLETVMVPVGSACVGSERRPIAAERLLPRQTDFSVRNLTARVGPVIVDTKHLEITALQSLSPKTDI